MHLMSINRLIEPLHVQGRNSLSKVCLDAVYTLVKQAMEASHVPLYRLWVGKVDKTHAGLPQVPLPNIAVLSLQQVSLFGCIFEGCAVLCDIGVDPHADFLDKAGLLQPSDLCFGVGESLRVEDEICPCEALSYYMEMVSLERKKSGNKQCLSNIKLPTFIQKQS